MQTREAGMKKTAAGIVLVLMVMASSFSSAIAASPYLSGSAALSLLGDSDVTPRSYDAGYALAGAVGLDSGQYRLEAELGSRKNGVKNSPGTISMTTFMGNAAVDLELPLAPVKPFLTAGVGLARVNEEQAVSGNVDDTVFAWQIGIGAGFPVAPLVSCNVQYRYFATSDPELADRKTYTVDAHNLMLGLRVGF